MEKGKNWYDIVQAKPETILCSAIVRKEPRQNIKSYHEGTNDILKIEIGYRHHDIIQRFAGELEISPYAQGFYTSKGRFVGRHEAMCIAYKSGLIPIEIAYQHSEEVEKDFVQFMNDMIVEKLLKENVDDKFTDFKLREDFYRKLGFKELFSEDLY